LLSLLLSFFIRRYSDVARISTHVHEKLRLQDELPFLVLFAHLVRFVVLPTDDFLALPTAYITNDMASRRHIPLDRIGFLCIDDCREKIRLAVLPTKVLRIV